MRLLASLRSWFAPKKEEPIDVLAALLRAADEDPDFRQRVEFVLRLPANQRESLLNTALREMELRGESASVRAGFALLATEQGASTALSYLERRS